MANLSLLLKCCFMFAIAISFSFCAAIENKAEDEHQSPLTQALAIIEMVSKVNVAKARVLSTALTNPLSALAELTLLGAFKIGFFLISGLFVFTGIFPGFLGALGIAPPFLFRSLTDSFSELKNLNYEIVARSIRSFPEKSFEALNVKGEDCRSRAICEVGEFFARQFPTVSGYMKVFGDKFSFNDKYMVAIVKGMSKTDCANSFVTCPTSPFKKLTNLSTYNIF